MNPCLWTPWGTSIPQTPRGYSRQMNIPGSANVGDLTRVCTGSGVLLKSFWRTRGDYRTARVVLEAIIAFSAMHTYYEQLLQVKQICLCLTGFTSLSLDAYVFLCSLVFHCIHIVLL